VIEYSKAEFQFTVEASLLSLITDFSFMQWTNDEDGVAHQLEKMEAEGRFSYQIKANNV
jgi:hypothetical protein